MLNKRIVALSAAVVAVAAGGAGAIAATSGEDAKKRESAVLSDAAKRLNVTPQELRDALGAAQDAQIDQAVKDGTLTKEQGEELKQRRQQSGRVLGFGGGPGRHGFKLRGARGFGLLDGLAKALGLSQSQLHEQLHDGKTLAEIATAQGKDLDDVKKAARAAAVERLDEAVKDGKLTKAQRDEMVEHLDEHLERLEAGLAMRMAPGRGHGPDGPPPFGP